MAGIFFAILFIFILGSCNSRRGGRDLRDFNQPLKYTMKNAVFLNRLPQFLWTWNALQVILSLAIRPLFSYTIQPRLVD